MFYEINPNFIFSSPTLFLIQYPLYRIKNEQIFDHKSRLVPRILASYNVYLARTDLPSSTAQKTCQSKYP